MTETLQTADPSGDAGRTGATGPGGTTLAPADRTSAIELLGLVARLELASFARLADDAGAAPGIGQQLALSRFAADSVQRGDRALHRIAELGGDPEQAVSAFEHLLDDFDARVSSSTWWERLLTSYVGYGVAEDFCRMAAAGIDAESRALVLEILDDTGPSELAVTELEAAGGGDEVLASRLALWGRRLVGEALGVVQQALVARPGLVRLVAEGGTGTEPPARLFGELTAQHTRRMARLGLTA
ncbi:hypothetical protein AGMMS50218_01290 [Actinomycetota bacterium]|nr:hypothetical protein AGMMS50218_01290 [Actinomycetota bacterium]